jgi:uncharacterized membrane protein YgaE (UPF0421/DUF939 family)
MDEFRFNTVTMLNDQEKADRILNAIQVIHAQVNQGLNLENNLKDCQAALIEINKAIESTDFNSEKYSALISLKRNVYNIIHLIKEKS